MMDLRVKFGWRGARRLAVTASLACVCSIGISPTKAQVAAPSQQPGSSARLINAEEGRSIVNSAWEQDVPAHGTQDCSHLVHQIYLNAGFEYPYASSYDIYAGNENFERVKMPQAGDLIAWPGHVGIVVDRLQHSFYSLVSTGLDAQDYEAPYWRSRGKARFYRYKVIEAGILNAAKAPASTRISHTARERRAAPVIEKRSPAESAASNRTPKTASGRTAVIYGPQIPTTPEPSATTTEVPPSIIIAAGNKQPTREEVAEGISELSNAAGNVLRANDPLKLPLPVVIVEQFSVERVEIKRDHGWAHLQVESRVAMAGGGTDLRRRREKVRWELRRTESGWEAVTPLDRTYVPHDVAVRDLAARLARLTESDGAAAHQETILHQESQIAGLLSALLENK
jgi:hypothetical protein